MPRSIRRLNDRPYEAIEYRWISGAGGTVEAKLHIVVKDELDGIHPLSDETRQQLVGNVPDGRQFCPSGSVRQSCFLPADYVGHHLHPDNNRTGWRSVVERYRVGMTHARLLRAESRVLAMDYGQFTLSGGSAVPLSEQRLLERAQASPPTASDGSTVLVLNPHQNNFSMEVEVELWSAPPALDSADWEQVSIERITVDEHETLRIGSPTCDDVECDVPRGEYRVEVSGRGFVNYGWPGSTHPGDRWRIRAWRDSSANHPNIRKVWEMPGFGTPWISNAVTVADESELDDDLDSSLPSTVESATRRSVARLWSDRGNRSHSKAAVEFDLEAEMKRRAAELANLALIAGEDEPLDEGDYDFGQAMEVTGPASETITVCFEESESDN